ncbi:uncharacterized protein M421DRAFT_423186 [Didymella exigua CBS 183.55]|uniref:Thioredoxin domain-containing protein n=1 Tax=Didymella exigua CBS 183.55 TaxID=1150837 RepID=A0A6A5RF27_9PLEO|nr:uncharacterized protein M421DRAFT_423186 [Didymella exigua CBS 183.55]KAF1925900.1 hypothetical protein M421DRAFT_423186 [Didymella exigua CBS 183.55]
MPVQDHYQVPSTAHDLPVPETANAKLYVAFIAGTDPVTKQSWCPDVRAALPRLQKAFSSEDAPHLLYVHVGQKPEWKDLGNVYRTKWEVKAVPQLVRYQRVDGEIRATGKLVEDEVNDDKKLGEFVNA